MNDNIIDIKSLIDSKEIDLVKSWEKHNFLFKKNYQRLFY